MIQKLTNKLNDRKNNKGFTLVELIVVIVILAILAAILIPGLLKWIDKAKEEQYVLEARNVYLATEAELAQNYANGISKPNAITDDSLDRIIALSSVDVKSITIPTDGYSGLGSAASDWDIIKMTITFNSRGKGITATLENRTWNITVGTAHS